VGGGTIEVSITGTPSVPVPALLRWVDGAAQAVTAYLGRYPVPRVRLHLRTGRSGAVGYGMTHGGRTPSIRIDAGRDVDEGDLRDDWVLTHEMVHLAFPDLTTDDRWAEEGLATYVEPLARARLGVLSEDEVWSGLIDGLPQGLPGRGDRGLHGTGEWGRTYWGGALYWLLADVAIREKTRNQRGLPDALAGIAAAGGDIRASWDLVRTLDAGDRALGLTVLSDLYRELGVEAGRPDLGELWRRLGVRRVGGRLVYDDSAALAPVRRAIVGPPPRARDRARREPTVRAQHVPHDEPGRLGSKPARMKVRRGPGAVHRKRPLRRCKARRSRRCRHRSRAAAGPRPRRAKAAAYGQDNGMAGTTGGTVPKSFEQTIGGTPGRPFSNRTPACDRPAARFPVTSTAPTRLSW
jgi:hypothetical protein